MLLECLRVYRLRGHVCRLLLLRRDGYDGNLLYLHFVSDNVVLDVNVPRMSATEGFVGELHGSLLFSTIGTEYYTKLGMMKFCTWHRKITSLIPLPSTMATYSDSDKATAVTVGVREKKRAVALASNTTAPTSDITPCGVVRV